MLPNTISAQAAAATMLRGLTTHMLLTDTFPVGPDTIMLVHAAAGGLGTLLTRWGKALGATVIGTVSSEEKAETARENGADHVLVGRDCDFVTATRRLTNGVGFMSPMTASVEKLCPKPRNACAISELWRASVKPVEKSPRPSLMHLAIKQIFLSSGQV